MILDQTVDIKISNRNISTYKDLGYICEINKITTIDIKDLTCGSRIEIKCKCFNCDNIIYLSYKQYYKNTNKLTTSYYCIECTSVKTKNTVFKKYNVENISLLEETKNKIKNSNATSSETRKKQINTRSNNTLNKYTKFNKKNEYDFLEYKNRIFRLKHNCNNIFEITYDIFYNRRLHETYCTKCYHTKSGFEIEVEQYLKELNIEYIINDTKILKGKEIDFFLPKYNLAIECNGLYWHSDIQKDRDYHHNKSIDCKNKGIELIHIWEDDWIYDNQKIKDILFSKILGETLQQKKLRIKDNCIFYKNSIILKYDTTIWYDKKYNPNILYYTIFNYFNENNIGFNYKLDLNFENNLILKSLNIKENYKEKVSHIFKDKRYDNIEHYRFKIYEAGFILISNNI